jgi:hypothetical protein
MIKEVVKATLVVLLGMVFITGLATCPVFAAD